VIKRKAPVCTNLRAKSNDGDRKIAIVIDSSSSMELSDPFNLRFEAANQAVDWLIEKSEVSQKQKQDQVTIISFDSDAYLEYPLGDPSSAAKNAVNGIISSGDTYIAGGVEMAISELTKDGSDDTAGRTGILVFTDGEDYDTQTLVTQIDRASGMSIRVAFGFLSSSSTVQASEVLASIMHSGGRYFTIPNYNASKAFIDGIIVNGLTRNDNPDGDTTTLLSGLDTSHFISGSETQTMTYTARNKERLTFRVESINAGALSAEVVFNGKTLAKEKASLYNSGMTVVSPGDGKMDVKVTASNAQKESIFVVGVTSNLPPQNCTVGVGPGSKPSNKAKIIAPSTIGGITLFSLLLYFLFKYFYPHSTAPGAGGHPPAGPSGGEKAPDVNVHPYQGDGGTQSFFKFPTHAPATPIPPPLVPPTSKKSWWSFPDHNPVNQAPPQHPAPPQNSAPQDCHDTPPENDDVRSLDNDDDVGSEYADFEDRPNEASEHGHNDMPPDGLPNQPPDQCPPDRGAHNPTGEEKRRVRVLRLRTYGNNHHHHISPQHPCHIEKCKLASPEHYCTDATHKCTCVDPKCKLNSRLHRCGDQNFRHTCMGPGIDPNCPLNDPKYAQQKKEERNVMVRKYVAQDLAKKGVMMTAMHLLKAGGQS
jgi:hypothetical protein